MRLLLIGESAPYDGGAIEDRRFFYLDRLTRSDNLFRAVVHALYGEAHLDSKTTVKQTWLDRIRNDGVFLIDLVPYPVNQLSSHAERARVRRENVGSCVERAAALRPTGVIVCHGPSFVALARPLKYAGVAVLHDEPIPFPLGNHRAEFVERFRRAASKVGMPGVSEG